MYGKGEYIQEKWSDAGLRTKDVTIERRLYKWTKIIKHQIAYYSVRGS